MTQALSAPTSRADEFRLVGPICAAHFVSHYYMIILAPLFAFIQADYRLSYTELALALTVFNVVSAAFQTPAGFLVDRVGARVVLVAGLALGVVAFAIAGLVNSYAVFVAMFAVAGLGNTAYHPADYSLLSQHTPPSRIGQVFSFHTFAGILGSAVAPATILAVQSQFGWRGAFVGAAILGAAVLALLLLQWPAESEHPVKRHAPKPTGKADDQTPAQQARWSLLLSTPILLNLGFFMLISVMGGINTILVVALAALYGTPDTVANVSLTALLGMNAVGVLVGGYLASRTTRHVTVAALSLALAGAATLLMGLVGHSTTALIAASSFAGLFTGIVSPSRDMLVRAVTPPGAFGRVFGFVSSGFNIGSMFAPMIYATMMDRGEPRTVFIISAACSILCIGTVIFGNSGRERREASV
jgi:MFS transporter, FSR family, fosmidomycin resistance protein